MERINSKMFYVKNGVSQGGILSVQCYCCACCWTQALDVLFTSDKGGNICFRPRARVRSFVCLCVNVNVNVNSRFV